MAVTTVDQGMSRPVSMARHGRRIFEGRQKWNSEERAGHTPEVGPKKKSQQDGDRVQSQPAPEKQRRCQVPLDHRTKDIRQRRQKGIPRNIAGVWQSKMTGQIARPGVAGERVDFGYQTFFNLV